MRDPRGLLVLLFLSAAAAAVLLRIAVDRLRPWFREHMPIEIQMAWVGVFLAVMGLALSHERRWWVWTGWIVGLGAVGWWIAHRVMGALQSRIEERHELFRRGIPPRSDGTYAGWENLGRIYDRAETDPGFQAFLRRIAVMSDGEWRAVLGRSKGLAALRRAKILRAVERTDPDAREAATAAILEALVKPGDLPLLQGTRMAAVRERADAARAAGEALLARHQIERADFQTLYEAFEGVLPASRLLSATDAPETRLGESHDGHVC